MDLTVIDGIFAVIVLIAVIIGIVKGFYKLITPPIKLVAAIALTFMLASPIIDSVTAPFFQNSISESIANSLAANYPDLSSANAVSTMPFMFKVMAFFAGVDLTNINPDAGPEGTVASAIGHSIGAPVGNFVAVIVTYLALFIIISLLLKLILSLLGRVLTAGPLNVVDKVLGFVFSVAVSSLLCCIIATIVGSISPELDGGFLYDFFRSLNPFLPPVQK